MVTRPNIIDSGGVWISARRSCPLVGCLEGSVHTLRLTELHGITMHAMDEGVCPTESRPMTGLFAALSDNQKKLALSYRGHENHGDSNFTISNRTTYQATLLHP